MSEYYEVAIIFWKSRALTQLASKEQSELCALNLRRCTQDLPKLQLWVMYGKNKTDFHMQIFLVFAIRETTLWKVRTNIGK